MGQEAARSESTSLCPTSTHVWKVQTCFCRASPAGAGAPLELDSDMAPLRDNSGVRSELLGLAMNSNLESCTWRQPVRPLRLLLRQLAETRTWRECLISFRGFPLLSGSGGLTRFWAQALTISLTWPTVCTCLDRAGEAVVLRGTILKTVTLLGW